jgi:hypothetical protein
MPINIGQPIAILAAIATLLVGGYLLVDKIGDLREAQVRTQYAEAAHRKNLHIADFNDADAAVSAIIEQAVQKGLDAAALVAGNCPANPDQAKAITAIRRLK